MLAGTGGELGQGRLACRRRRKTHRLVQAYTFSEGGARVRVDLLNPPTMAHGGRGDLKLFTLVSEHDDDSGDVEQSDTVTAEQLQYFRLTVPGGCSVSETHESCGGGLGGWSC